MLPAKNRESILSECLKLDTNNVMKSLQQFFKQVDILRDVEAQRREREKKKIKDSGYFRQQLKCVGKMSKLYNCYISTVISYGGRIGFIKKDTASKILRYNTEVIRIRLNFSL